MAMSDLIEPFEQHLRAGGQSDQTVRLRTVILRHCDRLLPEGGLDTASPSDLAAVLSRYAGNTLCSVFSTLRIFYRWATDPRDRWLDWDPTEALKQPPTPVVPAPGQRRRAARRAGTLRAQLAARGSARGAGGPTRG